MMISLLSFSCRIHTNNPRPPLHHLAEVRRLQSRRPIRCFPSWRTQASLLNPTGSKRWRRNSPSHRRLLILRSMLLVTLPSQLQLTSKYRHKQQLPRSLNPTTSDTNTIWYKVVQRWSSIKETWKGGELERQPPCLVLTDTTSLIHSLEHSVLLWLAAN